MQTHAQALIRLRRLLTLLAAALATSGCSPLLRPQAVLFVAVGSNSEQRITGELRQDIQERLEVLETGFQRLHPDTNIQVGLYQADQLMAAMQRRSQAGLEPDLLFVNGDAALQLLSNGLIDPMPASPALLNNFAPELLDRVRDGRGRLAGLPVLVQTQLSCFDRRRVPQAPATLAELLQMSAGGQAVGLTVDPAHVLWTAGSLDAIPALQHVLHGKRPSAEDRAAVTGWLRWLGAASSQQRITFFGSQAEAEAALLAGEVSWIACSSISVPMLRRHLGNRLGVAPLPNGPNGQPAAAVNRVRVIALGRHSSTGGRQRALAYARYSVNPLTQRTMTTGSRTVLPANRFVTVPVQSSQLLEAMQIAADQGRQSNALVAVIHGSDQRGPQLKVLLTSLVFGETTADAASDALLKLLQVTP